MKIHQPTTLAQAAEILNTTGCSAMGVEIMSKKAVGFAIEIGEFSCSLANILKQEALSCGCDAATHELTSRCGVEKTKIVLVGNLSSLLTLAKKIQQNVGELPTLGENLEKNLIQPFN